MTSSYFFAMLASFAVMRAVFVITGRGSVREPVFYEVLFPLSVVCCALMAKISYILLQFRFALADGFVQTLFSTRPDTFSFYGGAAGVVLAVILCARITSLPVENTLNEFAPAGLLLCSLARFAEYALGDFGTGWYFDPAQEPEKCFFPLSVHNEWDEWHLAVFMIEGILMLAMFVVVLRMKKEKRFLRALFYLALPQIFCESLRTASISWMFVRVEQLLCMLLVGGVLLTECLLSEKKRGIRRFMPLILWLISAGVFVAVEFAANKSAIPYLALYSVMILVLCILGWTECRSFAGIRKEGKNI